MRTISESSSSKPFTASDISAASSPKDVQTIVFARARQTVELLLFQQGHSLFPVLDANGIVSQRGKQPLDHHPVDQLILGHQDPPTLEQPPGLRRSGFGRGRESVYQGPE